MGRVSDELMETYKRSSSLLKIYNEKPPVYWFQLFSRDGIHTDAKYIPEDLWYGTILPYYSNMFLDVLMKINVCTTCYFQMYVDREQL